MKNIPSWARILLFSGILLFIVIGAIFWIINSKGPLATIVSVVFVALSLVFSFLQTFPLTQSPHAREPTQVVPQIIVQLPASSPITHKLLGDEIGIHTEERTPIEQKKIHEVSLPVHREDWGEAPAIEHFYGRKEELDQLTRWTLEEKCRMITVLGAGGLGKTTLATYFATREKNSFDYIFWRSVQNTPVLEDVLSECLQFLGGPQSYEMPRSFDRQISLLVEYFREYRCLFILDNFESVLQKGQMTGEYISGYETYGQLLQRLGTVQHQSCLLLTSREKPREIARLQGNSSSVRVLQITGMSYVEARAFLEEHGLFGSDTAKNSLIDLYSGNPLALKLVSEPIREVFGGDVARFLQEERSVFGDIQTLLSQQFERLSSLEQAVMYWLAIERELVSLQELQIWLNPVVQKEVLFEVLSSLRRRSMLETSGANYFTLQPVVIEYVTSELVRRVYGEIQAEVPILLVNHALLNAKAKDYVRNSQIRFIFEPLSSSLLHKLSKKVVEQKLYRLLDALHTIPGDPMSYVAGNILNLLLFMQYDVSQYDFSHLTIREAYLRGAFLTGVNFSYAHFIDSVFSDTFSGILSIAFNSDGTTFAAATAHGDIRLWQANTGRLLSVLRGHSDAVWSVAFSPDGKMLASGSQDKTIRFWDSETGQCQRVISEYGTRIWAVSFHPGGKLLASGSEDQHIRLWDVATGTCLQSVHEYKHRVLSITFNPEGTLLASGSEDRTICVWEMQEDNIHRCTHILDEHHGSVRTVAFHPDGVRLASGSEDQTIRLWDASNGKCLKILQGHKAAVRSVAFNVSGSVLASGGDDRSVHLWDVQTGTCFNTLRRQANRIWSVAYSFDGLLLASGGDDQAIHVWDARTERALYTLQGYQTWVWSVAYTRNGDLLTTSDSIIRLWVPGTKQLLQTFQAHTNRIRSLACSPDGKQFASGSEDHTICLWEIGTKRLLHTLQGHTDYVRSVAYSPDGALLASGSDDGSVRVWDTKSGKCLYTIQDDIHEQRSIAFRCDGQILVGAGVDTIIRLWDTATGQMQGMLQGHGQRIRTLAFHPWTMLLASGSADGSIRLWDTQTKQCVNILQASSRDIRAVAFHPDGITLASSSDESTICIWNIGDLEASPLVLHGHEGRIRTIAFNVDGDELASGSDDGTIKLWDTTTGQCKETIRSDRPYERMNILGATGLTDAQSVSLRELGAIEK